MTGDPIASDHRFKRFIEGKTSVVAKWLKAPYNFDGWRIDVANMTGRIRDEDMYLEVAQIVRKTMVDVNPDTIMPAYGTSATTGWRVHPQFQGKALLQPQDIEDIVAYLMQMKP